MTKLEREAYINTACKYYWILSVLKGTVYYRNVVEYNLHQMDNVLLEINVYNIYKNLKIEIVQIFLDRRNKYEQNRREHMEQKTADKQFYRFLQATGYLINPTPLATKLPKTTLKLPIRRLIKIYSVYFKDLGKMKRDLDKAGKSPYIG